MNKYFTFLLLLCGFLPLKSQTIYVKLNGTGNGSSWQNASGNLRTVLANANKNAQIWVAQGTYYPTQCGNCTETERRLSFEIPDSVAVYGGFNGTESTLAQRNWQQNVTILNGDIDRDGDIAKNAYHVIYTHNVGAQTILDGFTVTGGNANNAAIVGERYTSGGGLYNDGRVTGTRGNPSVSNCIFNKNQANGFGGAVYNGAGYGGICTASFKNCQFTNNYSVQEGGAVNNSGEVGGNCNPFFDFCLFTNNRSGAAGGAVFSNAVSGTSQAVYRNCQFVLNQADTYGGGIYNQGKQGNCSPTIIGCLFWKNTALSAAGVYCLGSEGGNSNPYIANCIFYKNEAHTGGSVYSNANDATGHATPYIVNCIIWGNKADVGRHLRNIYSTPIISHSIIDTTSCEAIHSGLGVGVSCRAGMIYNQDPLFVNPDAGDFHFKPASPAINAGLDSAVLVKNDSLDIEGFSRIKDKRVDIGCYEFNPTVYFAPEIISSPENKTVCEKEVVQLKVRVSATPPLFYQWYKNNAPIANATADSLKFLNITLSDAGTYKCVIKNNVNATVTSADALVQIKPLLPLSINITNSRSISCENDTAVFLTTFKNGGTKPKFQWLLNDVSLGMPDTLSQLTVQYQSSWHYYKCRIISSEQCAIPNALISNDLQYNVIPNDTSKITISGPAAEHCVGLPITINAVSENGGSTPQYRWLVNGVERASGSASTFISSTLAPNDKVKCLLVSSKKCVFKNPLQSNEYLPRIRANTTVGISLMANKTTLCTNEMVDFTATSTGTGTTPQYQWYINATPVGTNWFTFQTNVLKNKDVVKVRLTSSETCTTQNPAESNAVTTTVNVCTAVQDLANENIKIYPNPSTESAFTLDIQNLKSIFKIEVFNPIGQLILTKKIDTIIGQSTISISLPTGVKGIYGIKIKGDNVEIFKKWLLNDK